MKKIGKVSILLRYPVKSMQGEKLKQTIITEKGLLGDRSYAMIDLKSKKAISAKNPRKWPEIFKYSSSFSEEPTLNKLPDIKIKLPDNSAVYSSQNNINEVLSEAFNSDIILSSNVPNNATLEGLFDESIRDVIMPKGTFFDIGIIHLLTTSTLAKLEELYEEGIFKINRFRANIIIEPNSNEKDFIENNWVGKKIYIGEEVILKIKQTTSRCVMTTLEQEDLPKDINILRTIKKNNDGKAGIYADVIKTGVIKVDDSIFIEE
ncbi:MOSC domain-containing protein [Halarcobacter mediterraneus]|uniref:MOSC domain-containing protein n=1 Tax=Halarcobacter mediterraneus TaxID=2023153 RepID=A0A4V1M0Y9_9BACT|nr:MOSC N-terminal beta barrel domain-containing protein [Halarcobacter mediterraneus]RXK11525.1 MOSC domain-containing protein [Halarcobacter mediterraneus]